MLADCAEKKITRKQISTNHHFSCMVSRYSERIPSLLNFELANKKYEHKQN